MIFGYYTLYKIVLAFAMALNMLNALGMTRVPANETESQNNDSTIRKMTQIPLADQLGSFWKSGEYEACACY
ncbi:MAG: hypothetical protein DRI44_07485 [Chlamydiae bacterium]|nr:MAG: hypothetical protein DRI44_07485 [Chlamydiota bacterium]